MRFFDIYSTVGVLKYCNYDTLYPRWDFIKKLWQCRLETAERPLAESILPFLDNTLACIQVKGQREYDLRLKNYLNQDLSLELKGYTGKNGNSHNLLKEGIRHFELDQPIEALTFFSPLALEEPTQKIYLMIAECFVSLGLPILAIKAYETAESTWTESPAITLRKGDIWTSCGCYSQALLEYGKYRGPLFEKKFVQVRRYLGLYNGAPTEYLKLPEDEQAELDIGHVIIECLMGQSSNARWAEKKLNKWKDKKIYKAMMTYWGDLK